MSPAPVILVEKLIYLCYNTMQELAAFDIINIKVHGELKFCKKYKVKGSKGAIMIQGIVAVIAASVAYGFLPVFCKFALDAGMSSASVVFWRYFLACVVMASIMCIKKVSFRVTKAQLAQLCLFGLLGSGITSLLLTVAYQYIPIGLATMFHFAYPLFVTFIMIAMFREKATVFKCLSMAAALGGLWLMADFSKGISLPGVVFAVLSGLTYAVYIIATRKSAFAVLPIFTTLFYVTFFSSLFFSFQQLITGSFLLPPSAKAWMSVAATSLLCTVFALCLLMWGIQQLGPVTASVLNMIEPVTSVVAGIAIFNDKLSLKSLLGCLLIVSSALLISMDAKRSALRSKEAKKETAAVLKGGECL